MNNEHQCAVLILAALGVAYDMGRFEGDKHPIEERGK